MPVVGPFPTPTGEPLLIPLSALCEDPDNPRTEFPPAELQELAEDIRQHGILQPIVVRPADADRRYFIHFGRHKHLAPGLRCQRQPEWRCAACRLDADCLGGNPDIQGPTSPNRTVGAGRITTRQRRNRQFQANQAGIGRPPMRQSGVQEAV